LTDAVTVHPASLVWPVTAGASPLSTPAASFGPEIASRGIPAVLGGDRRPQAQTAPSGAQTFLSLCRCTLVRARVLADTLRTAMGGKEQHIQIWTAREAAGSFPRSVPRKSAATEPAWPRAVPAAQTRLLR
jgi:hypothetical protein